MPMRVFREHRPLVVALLAGGILFCVAACQSAPPPPNAVLSATSVTVLAAVQTRREATPTAIPQEIIDAADAEYALLTNVYERVAPSVVNIDVSFGGSANDSSSGSGFIYDLDGHVITNAHVVQDAREITITFNDGVVARAEVVGVDNFSDLAVLRADIPADHLIPVIIGDSDAVKIGERAIAIGNPFGLSSSMTVGIVSGLGRQLPSAELNNSSVRGFDNPSIIQVDTDINPGNSGGPLLNSRGQVIGVNTAIRTESGVFQGVGFAVPASTVLRVVPELIANGRVQYAWLGITTLPNENGYSVAALAEALGLSVRAGVLIESILPGSPAAVAGLRGGSRLERIRTRDTCVGGDIIVAINEMYVNTMDDLTAYMVANSRPGATVTLLVVRGADTFEIDVFLTHRPLEILDFTPCGGS